MAQGVPRETLSEPEELASAASAVFAQRPGGLDLARRFAGHLATSGVERGLVGPREVPRLWERHVLNCAVVAPLVPAGARVVDVGSGAGLPGLALAIARPDAAVTLVEPLERRVAWLQEVVDDLDLDVAVVRARAEEVRSPGPRHVPPAPVVTARAVARLDKLARWCLPLVEGGGQLLALKGRTAAEELAEAAPELRRLGAVATEVVSVGGGLVETATTVVRVTVGSGRRTARREEQV